MAMEGYTVSQLARLTGVTARALRHYDAIGLLRPGRTTEAGYRLYGPAEVDRLQLILFYRKLGVELAEIGRWLDGPDFDRAEALAGHLRALEERRARLDRLIATARRSLAQEQGGTTMTDIEKFECFKRETLRRKEAQFGAEARARYGDQAVEEADRNFLSLTKEEYDAWTALGEEIRERLRAAVRAGCAPEGEEGAAVAQLHRQWLTHSWTQYSPEAHRGLAALYPEEPGFLAYYDGEVPGCAAFLRDAVLCHVAAAQS